jgi:hypothetical protein
VDEKKGKKMAGTTKDNFCKIERKNISKGREKNLEKI